MIRSLTFVATALIGAVVGALALQAYLSKNINCNASRVYCMKVFIDPHSELQVDSPTLRKIGPNTTVYWLIQDANHPSLKFPQIVAGNPLVGIEFFANDGGTAEFGCNRLDDITYQCTDEKGAKSSSDKGYKYIVTAKEEGKDPIKTHDPYIVNN